MKATKQYTYTRLPDAEYNNHLSQFMRRVHISFESIKKQYGLRNEIDGKIDFEIQPLAEAYGMALRGKKQPVQFPPHIERHYELEGRYNADD